MSLIESILGKEANVVATFEIGRKQKNEDFTLETLVLRHKECEGGSAKIKLDPSSGNYGKLTIICARCGFRIEGFSWPKMRQDVALLAVDPAHETTWETGWILSSRAVAFKTQSS